MTVSRKARGLHFGIAAALAMGLMVSPAGAQNPTNAHPSIAGMWWTGDGIRHLATSTDAIPFTPAGKAAYKANRKNIKSGRYRDRVEQYCMPEGVPRVMLNGYPFEIVSLPEMVLLRYEKHHSFRRVLLNDAHPDPDDYEPTMLGDSIAHWEQDTLVIDTIGIKPHSVLDATGLPYGERLHVVERLKRLDDGRLEYLVTIEDPEMYVKPWSSAVVFTPSPDTELQEWICGDPHRTLPGAAASKRSSSK